MSNNNKTKAIFFDRDGIINKVIFRENKISSPWRLEEFEIIPQVRDILLEFQDFLKIVFTNQPDVSRGNLAIEELERMHKLLLEKLPIDDIEYCIHDDHHNCSCRKPKPGLLFQAAEKYNIDLSNSYVVGDSWKDIKAGKTAGCKTILIRTEYNKDYFDDYDFEVSQLKEIVEIIKKIR